MNKYIFVCGTSRTGTTLMVTILDSHRNISMGYELPTYINKPPNFITDVLNLCISKFNNNSKECYKCAKNKGHDLLGKLIIKAQLSSVSPKELSTLCLKFHNKGYRNLNNKDAQFHLAKDIVDLKCKKEKNKITGFKIATGNIAPYYEMMPNGYYICMIRDPRDVFSSLKANNFPKKIKDFTKSWNSLINNYTKFNDTYPTQNYLMKYENLVSSPDKELTLLFDNLELDYRKEVNHFFKSKASIHKYGGNMNVKNLKKNFFKTSISRWKKELSSKEIKIIENTCGENMKKFNYL